LYAANKAKTERDLARQEVEALKMDAVKLEQILRDQNTEIDALKKKMQQCEARPKPKPAVKKKAAPAKSVKKSSKNKSSKKKSK
jgi:hypothetical protein